MASPVPHHRHQASLEDVIDLSPQVPLGAGQRTSARRVFYRIVEHFEAHEPPIDYRARKPSYSQPRLVRFTYEYARSDESRDIFLRAFCKAVALDLDGAEEGVEPGAELDLEELKPLFNGFAEHLMDNFFLPCTTRPSFFFF